MLIVRKYKLAFILCMTSIELISGASFNPSILQDSRDLPKVDGTFGFLYRTEDGIAHAAKGDSNGYIQGRFSYTDPTGLKVNYNYNAGSRVTPGYNYDAQPAPRGYQPQQYQEPQYTRPAPPPPPAQPQYIEPPQYRPQPKYTRTRGGFRGAEDVYQQRRFRPSYAHANEVYDDYY